MLFCMEYLKFALRVIWKKFFIRFYIENKEIFLTTLYGKPKPHKKVIFKALLRLFLRQKNIDHFNNLGKFLLKAYRRNPIFLRARRTL